MNFYDYTTRHVSSRTDEDTRQTDSGREVFVSGYESMVTMSVKGGPSRIERLCRGKEIPKSQEYNTVRMEVVDSVERQIVDSLYLRGKKTGYPVSHRRICSRNHEEGKSEHMCRLKTAQRKESPDH